MPVVLRCTTSALAAQQRLESEQLMFTFKAVATAASIGAPATCPPGDDMLKPDVQAVNP
jgi:hypothetical protein